MGGRGVAERGEGRRRGGAALGLDLGGVEHGAHAGAPVAEGDDPEPAALADDDADVPLLDPLGPGDACELGEDGHGALQHGELLPAAPGAPAERVATGGVQGDGGAESVLHALRIAGDDADGAPLLEDHPRGFPPVADLGAEGDGVLQEHLVEAIARDLEGVGAVRADGVGEGEAALAAGGALDEAGAVLAEGTPPRCEASPRGVRAPRRSAGAATRRRGSGGERLALQHQDPAPGARQETRRGGAAGPAADDHDIVALTRGFHALSRTMDRRGRHPRAPQTPRTLLQCPSR